MADSPLIHADDCDPSPPDALMVTADIDDPTAPVAVPDDTSGSVPPLLDDAPERREASSRSNSTDRGKRRSRASSKNGRRSRSLSRVSIERNSQTQSEVDEAAKTINKQPGGVLLLSLIQEINKQPGTNIDLLTIAKQVDKGNAQNEPMQKDTPNEFFPPMTNATCASTEHEDPITNNRAQFIMKSPFFNRTQDRQHIRDTLLDIELNDRTVQRRMINPPCHFHQGHSSISDHDQVRLDKVKIYFSAAFGNKKFSGKRTRGNDDISILQLLQDFNHAQSTIAVTEREFVTFLTKAMTGEAHKTMLNYQDLHRNGAMSIEDIYLSLTDIYFSDLRPNTAMQRLRDFNENNHPYLSLSEAHNDLLQLCNLASLAARARERQIVLASDWYQHTLLKIIPKEYKPMATSLVESCGNYKGKDLDPHEILNCLNKIRHPIDDIFRKNNSKQMVSLKNKKTSVVMEDPQLVEGITANEGILDGNESNSQIKVMSNLSGEQNYGKNRSRPPPDKGQTPAGCKLCGNPAHTAQKCLFFPEGKNAIAGSECKRCKSNLFHFARYCPKQSIEDNPKN